MVMNKYFKLFEEIKKMVAPVQIHITHHNGDEGTISVDNCQEIMVTCGNSVVTMNRDNQITINRF